MALMFALAAIVQAVPATPPPAIGAAAMQKGGPDEKICRRGAATGSIMPTRTCHSRAEWQAIEHADNSGVDAFRNRPLPTGSASGR